MSELRVPLWLKIAYTAWVVVWFVLYKQFVDWPHYLWLCHIGNIIIVAGLWIESPLLLSWQALALLIPDLIWSFDFLVSLPFGRNQLGVAWYMFGSTFPPLQKALSLFHLFLPLVLIGCLRRFGYDRRALWLQIATCWVLFPISYIASRPEDNVNWVYGPFGQVQHVVTPLAYVPVAMLLYIIVLYIPAHLLLTALARRPRAGSVQ